MSLLQYSQIISFIVVSQHHWPIKIKMILNSQQCTVTLTSENYVFHFKPFFIFLAIILKRNLVKMKSLRTKNVLCLISWKGWGSLVTEQRNGIFCLLPHSENKFFLFLNVTEFVCFKIAALSRWCVSVQEEASEPKIPGHCRHSRTWVTNSRHISCAKQKERFLEFKDVFQNFFASIFPFNMVTKMCNFV